MRCSKSCYLYDLELVELKIVQGCTIFKHYTTNQRVLKVNLTVITPRRCAVVPYVTGTGGKREAENGAH